MIHSIRGRIVELTDTSAAIEDSSGVTWELEISARTKAQLADMRDELRMLCHLNHREDQMSLFGFLLALEKQCFLLLMKVNGIGPKQAMKILSFASPEELAAAIVAEDEAFLTSLPGIGLKGAKKIILSLKDQIGALGIPSDSSATASRSSSSVADAEGFEHLLEALVQMGFERKEARSILETLFEQHREQNLPEGELLRRAIVALS